MAGSSHSIGEEIQGVLIFLVVLWIAYLVDWVVVPIDFNKAFGLVPRTMHGLIGIPAMPLLHDGIGHLTSNTIPLFVLLVLLAGSRARTWETVGEIILLGGLLLWVFGRGLTHVGASGLVFGLVAFLIVSGLRERRVIPMFVSAVVAFLYGGTLIAGVLPRANSEISWDGHLFGAIAGVVVALAIPRGGTSSEDDESAPA